MDMAWPIPLVPPVITAIFAMRLLHILPSRLNCRIAESMEEAHGNG
jgi:hypothetical protein